uniref:Uncharacterized protein n=1 Tax=Arundo donax TaxID=35708 RepID=A0A0A8XTV1_ARUDO
MCHVVSLLNNAGKRELSVTLV